MWSGGEGFLLYARPLSDVDHTLARVRFFLAPRRARGHRARPAGRPGDGRTRDAPGRRAQRRRAGDRAHPRPEPPAPPPRGRRRGGGAGADARGDAAGARRAPATTPRRRSTASGSSSPTPPTSCARRSPRCWPTSSCWPRSSTASRPRPPKPRCVRRGGCAGWSATCCCWREPTPSGSSRAGRPSSRRSSSRRSGSSGRSPTATSYPSTSRRWSSRRRATSCRAGPQPARERRQAHPAGDPHPRLDSSSMARPCSSSRMTARESRPELESRVFERFVRDAGDGGRGAGPRPGDRAARWPSPTAAR